ncbi:MAG: hypothetical protein U0176_17125 [Bacteroidia bacterium]
MQNAPQFHWIPRLVGVGLCLLLHGQLTAQGSRLGGGEDAGDAPLNYTIPALKQASIVVEPTDTQLLTGPGGTTAMVIGKHFQFQDGTPVTGPIDFKMTEYQSKAEMLLSGLPTVSDGQMLASGGVVHLEATSEGKPLELIPGKTVPIRFKVQDPAMQLFSGVRDSNQLMNWKPMPPAPPVNQDFRPMNFIVGGGKSSPGYDLRFSYTNASLLKQITPFLERGTANDFEQRFTLTRTFVSQYILEELKRNYPCVGDLRHEVRVVHDKKGVPTTVMINGEGNPCLENAIPEIVSRIRWTTVDKYRLAVIPLQGRIEPEHPNANGEFVSLAENPAAPLDEATRKAFRALHEERLNVAKTAKNTEFLYQSVGITSLGWVNWDKFLPNSGSAMAVSADDCPTGTTIYLSMEGDLSLMAGLPFNGSTNFGGVADNQPAKLIALCTICGPTPMVAIQSIRTGDKVKFKEPLVPVSEQALRQKLETL